GSLRAFFTYRGSFFWKMQGGMGDVGFAPLYQGLKGRGGSFDFFHRLRAVRLGSGGGKGQPFLAGVDLDGPAPLRNWAEYGPRLLSTWAVCLAGLRHRTGRNSRTATGSATRATTSNRTGTNDEQASALSSWAATSIGSCSRSASAPCRTLRRSWSRATSGGGR